jgi:membrane protein
MVLLMVCGSTIAESIVNIIPALANFRFVILATRYAIGFVVLTIFFSCIFKVLPAHKVSLCEMIPGAVVSASGWIVFSALFGFYIDHFADYSKLYGGLTSIVLFLLWLYICMLILFFGAELSLLLRRIK